MVDIRDIKILEILQKNGRSTASDIAKEVDLSIPAVGERIKKHIEKGLIKRFSAILNHKKCRIGCDGICVYCERTFGSL